jgi:hypothetical protein
MDNPALFSRSSPGCKTLLAISLQQIRQDLLPAPRTYSPHTKSLRTQPISSFSR